jgi:hypothetical protein
VNKLFNIYIWLLLIFFTLNFLTTSIVASGGSGGGISQIPQGKDREMYHLGKAVYNSEITLGSVISSVEKLQLDKLEFLQGSIPNTEKRRVNLPELAGKLSNEQLEALEYFISIRFNVKLK